MLLMMDQHPQRGWRSRTRVLCAPRSGRRSLTATAAEGTRASAPSLLGATACREGRPFIMRGPEMQLLLGRSFARGWEDGQQTQECGADLAGSAHCLDWIDG